MHRHGAANDAQTQRNRLRPFREDMAHPLLPASTGTTPGDQHGSAAIPEGPHAISQLPTQRYQLPNEKLRNTTVFRRRSR